MTRIDCHQHLWPPSLLEALRSRTRPPFLDRQDVLHLDGEPPSALALVDHDLAARRRQDLADGVDVALLSPSSPLGVEMLPPEEAEPLLAAWHGLADVVGPGHRVWAAVNLVEPDLAGLAKLLDHVSVCGLQVPATAMADPASLERLAPVLATVEAADLPVLVHPGPAPASGADVPAWWPALTAYPAQQAAAWLAWHAGGRALLPRLRIAFVGLAGLEPLHHERLLQRGGGRWVPDAGVHYETSSYGPDAVGAMARVVGVEQLVLGSDRPWAVATDPGLGEAGAAALRVENPHRLLHGS